MTTQLKSFLSPRKVQPGSEFTHAGMGLNKGAYYIEGKDEEEFMTLYYDALEKGADLDIVEKHRDQSPILIDLDFKQDTEARRYTDEMIVDFLSVLKEQIMEYTDAHNVTFFVMEKGIQARPNKSGGFKDGIHIVCPDIVTKPEVQNIIRNNIIEKSIQDIFGDTFANSYTDIYDEAVIKKNGWFLLGSKKPDEEYPWVVTKVYNVDLKEIDNEYSDEDLLSLLSIRNKFECVAVKESKLQEVKAYKEKMTKSTVTSATVVTIPSSLEDIHKMVMMLKPERADAHKDWLRVGMVLKSISEECLQIWIEFSKQSPKYAKEAEGECRKAWRSLNPQNITEGTLRWMAKHDNPEAYKSLVANDTQKLVYMSRRGAHTDVARVVHHMFKDNYACCYIKDKPFWYEFKNHRWEHCPNGVSLKKRLSNEVFKLYSATASMYYDKAAKTDDETEQQTYTQAAKHLSEVTMQLKMTSYKSNIMTECTEFFSVSKKDFYDKLDTRKELIGFNNGVYDLDMGCFRDGMPDDMISMCCNVNYRPRDNFIPEYEDNIKSFIASLFEDQEKEDYLMDKLAGSVHGYKPEANILFLTGVGANGKTTLAALCAAALGEYYYQPDVKIFTCKRTSSSAASPDIAGTKGKRLVWASEPEESDKFQVGVLKNWSGGDKVQARELFKDFIEFVTQFQIVIAMNHLTGLSAIDGGITRRMRIVKFPLKFCNDPMPNTNQRQVVDQLQKRFETDPLFGEHFMSMLVERYVTRVHEKKVHVPQEVLQLSQDYLDGNNTVKKFMQDYVVTTGNDDDMVVSSEMYRVYKDSEYYNQGDTKGWVESRMAEQGFPVTRCKARTKPAFRDKMVYKGVKIVEPEYMIDESSDALDM
jgi:P4 family phage/plasmid primase-like protien